MKKAMTLAAAAALLGGCTTMGAPQTRADYVQAIAGGVPFTMTDSHVAKRRFDDVVSSLRQRAPECFDGTATMTRVSGVMTTMNVRDDYVTTVRTVSATRAELTTQFTSKGIIYVQKVPAGGFYSTAVDIERLGPSSTRLTYYGSSFDGGKKSWAALKQWSDGLAAPCP